MVPSTDHPIHPKGDTTKIKLITALTTVTLFALPVAEASAHMGWA
jgi:hypothetical protein